MNTLNIIWNEIDYKDSNNTNLKRKLKYHHS